MSDTRDGTYTQRLQRLQGARWKSLVGAQVPYRWNVRRLLAGHERVLDVGCGIGRNLTHLGRGVGVDHNAESVAIAREQGVTAYTTTQWPDSPDAVVGSYDAMLLAHVLEHLDEGTADELVESYLPYLTAQARLLLICPQERGYVSDATHVRWVDPDVLRASARRWGFRPVRAMSFPLPRFAGKTFPYNEFVLVADRLPQT
ncbi:MAG TPA: methyltransferase domain-containing protein [Candidatus Nanopelagicales bacterium]